MFVIVVVIISTVVFIVVFHIAVVVVVAHERLVEICRMMLSAEFRSRLYLDGPVGVDGVAPGTDILLVTARRSFGAAVKIERKACNRSKLREAASTE